MKPPTKKKHRDIFCSIALCFLFRNSMMVKLFGFKIGMMYPCSLPSMQMMFSREITLPETNSSPQWWFPIGISKLPGVYFQGRTVSFREGNISPS